MKDDQCIYAIIANLGSAYFIFVFTFHSTQEALGATYKPPSLEYFCDSLIRDKDKLLHIGVINTTCTYKKDLVAQHKDKYKHTKKQHPHKNKKNPLSQLLLRMVTNDQNKKVRRLRGIAIFVGEMVI